MKIALTLLSIFYTVLMMGQADGQWLVDNGGLTSNFYVINMEPPCITCNPNADNDFFVIYENGQHYNSRYSWSGRIPSDLSEPVVKPVEVVRTQTSSPVEYFYLTNLYEGDDWPPAAVSSSSTGPSQIHEIGITTPTEAITANHDIVRGKDITLIIKVSDLLRSGVNKPDKYILKFDKIVQTHLTTQPALPINDPFVVSSVFDIVSGDTYFYPTGLGLVNHGTSPISQIEIPHSSIIGLDYIYINLRPSINLMPYYPVTDNTSDYTMIFQIDVEDIAGVVTNIDTHREEIRDSHDPNFVKVESINKCGQEYFVCYHAQVQNTGLEPVTDFSIKVNLPGGLDYSCIDVKKVGNKKCSKIDMIPIVDGQNVTFEFDNCELKKCVKGDHILSSDDRSIGFVKFCVKIKDTNPNPRFQSWVANSGSNTEFAGRPYNIYDYFDLPCDEKPNDERRCTRPVRNNCDFECGPYKKKRRRIWDVILGKKYKMVEGKEVKKSK